VFERGKEDWPRQNEKSPVFWVADGEAAGDKVESSEVPGGRRCWIDYSQEVTPLEMPRISDYVLATK